MSSELEEIFQKGLIAGISKYGHLLSEEPEDLRVFSSDIPGFFNRKLMPSGFNLNDQISFVGTPDVNTYVDVNNYLSQHPDAANKIIICGSGGRVKYPITWSSLPKLEINNENILTRSGWGTEPRGYDPEAYIFIPIKHMEGVTKATLICMTEKNADHLGIGFYHLENGSIAWETSAVSWGANIRYNPATSSFPAYLNYAEYTINNTRNLSVDYIRINACYISQSYKCYWKELKFYKE